jgi:hypothetical protein
MPHCSDDFLAANFRLFKIKDLTGETTSHYEASTRKKALSDEELPTQEKRYDAVC